MRRFFAVLLMFIAATIDARAETVEAAVMVPPHLIGAPEVPYPAGALGDSVVELAITVAKDGSVTDVVVTTGLEPFSAAAAEAVRHFRFVPAERDGAPVAARIRFEVKFTEPKSAESPSASATAPAPGTGPSPPREHGKAAAEPPASATPAPKAQPPPEVTVHGVRAPPGAVSLGRAEVRQLPGAFGDPFRAIEAMPGVTPIATGVPFFYIRGAPPGNVGYFLDGVRVPYLFHVGLGPSVIHPGMVDRMDLFPGAYPVEYGRFAGGIVTANATTPTPSLHGEWNLRLFDAGALAEGGFANGRGTVLVGGRYSYTAAVVSLLAEGVTLDYRDYQARISYDLGRSDRVSLLGFGAYDLLGQTENGIFNVAFGAEFHRANLRWEHDLGDGGSVRTDFVLGFDQARIPNQPRNSRDDMAALRVVVNRPLSKGVTFRTGSDVTRDSYTADIRPYSDPDDPVTQRFNALFPPRDDLAVGTWADVVLKAGIAEVTPGVRVDLFDSGGESAVAVDPRIVSRLAVARRVHVIHTLGVVHQPPSFIIPLPGLAIANLRGGLQTGLQTSAGVEVEFPADTKATLTVSDNIFFDMSDTLGVARPGRNLLFREQRSLGSAIGLEFFVMRKLTQRLGGFISYTLSRSTRSVEAEHFPSSFDRTHVFSAAVAYDLGRRWRIGTRVAGYTGVPAVPVSNGLVPPPRSGTPPREPGFYRIDLRVEKKWQLSQSVWLAFVAELMNATLNKEFVFAREIGPVTIPSIGFEGAF